MRVYDGENLKDTDPKAKSVQEYRSVAGVDEGMHGISTLCLQGAVGDLQLRHQGVAADPVHQVYILEQAIKREQFRRKWRPVTSTSSSRCHPLCRVHRSQDPKAYLESYSEYGQNLFDRYISYADAWLEDGFQDADTGQILNRGNPRQRAVADKSRRHPQPPRISATRW